MAMFNSLLAQFMENPSSYTQSPGYKFTMDQGLNSATAKLASMGLLNSGYGGDQLVRTAGGIAAQGYDNALARMLQGAGMENQYDLGSRAADTSQFNADTSRQSANQNFGLDTLRTANAYDLGMRGLQQQGNKDWWSYQLDSQRNNQNAANAENEWNLGVDRNNANWYNAATNRGQARSDSYYRGLWGR